MKRHFVYLFLFTLWQFRAIYPVSGDIKNHVKKDWKPKVFKIGSDVAAILMAAARIRMEPYVWYLF